MAANETMLGTQVHNRGITESGYPPVMPVYGDRMWICDLQRQLVEEIPDADSSGKASRIEIAYMVTKSVGNVGIGGGE